MLRRIQHQPPQHAPSFRECHRCQRQIETHYFPIHQVRCARRPAYHPSVIEIEQTELNEAICRYCNSTILKKNLKSHQRGCKLGKRKCSNCSHWVDQLSPHENCETGGLSQSAALIQQISIRLQDAQTPYLTIQLPLNHQMNPAQVVYDLFTSTLQGIGELSLEDLLTEGRTISLSQRATRQLRRRTRQTSQIMSTREIQESLANMIYALVFEHGIRDEGLSEEEIRTLRRRIHANQEQGERMCSICQCELMEGQKLIVCGCQHEFHEQCLVPWLRMNSACPNCKQPQK